MSGGVNQGERFGTVAIVPARGGSRSIPRKNVLPFAGMPLLYWVVRAAHRCAAVDHVFVATEDHEIAETVRGFGFGDTSIFHRSAASASDAAASEAVLLEIAGQVDFDTLVFLQATSPFTTEDDLAEALALFTSQGFDSLLSVVAFKRFLWEERDAGAAPLNYDYRQRPRRQAFPGCYLENGAFYVCARRHLIERRNRLGGRIGLYVMPAYTGVEIDEPDDWVVAEALFRRHRRPAVPGAGA